MSSAPKFVYLSFSLTKKQDPNLIEDIQFYMSLIYGSMTQEQRHMASEMAKQING